MKFKKAGSKTLYYFIDQRCIGRKCWHADLFQHRAPLAGGGSMNTSSPPTPCCMNRAYRGCPEGPEGEVENEDGSITVGLPIFDVELAKRRKLEGWKAVAGA